MPPAVNCPRCGRPSSPNVSFCASCGTTLFATPSGKGWKLFLGVFALFAGLVWVAALFTRPQPPTQLVGASQPQALASSPSGLTAQQATPLPPLTLTSVQHLAEAKRALADGYKPNKDPQKAQWGEIAAAKWHLKAIGTTAPEYREAQELLKEVARRERQIELARKKAEADKDAGETAGADAAEDDADEASEAVSSSTAPSSPSGSAAARQSSPAVDSSSEYYTNSRGKKVHRPVFSDDGPPAGATAQCRDGSYSFSQSRRGTCSHHGGVARWL